jgi:hypothetical protein
MTTGDSYRIVMPNSRVTVRVSTLWWQYVDPRGERSKIEPAIKANLAYVEFQEGRRPRACYAP